ncbi:phage late control D family protein [Aquitalea magnusonii]|uniref:Phage protein D n=1 Tax=Aquitalea magnusonii TaxID=332411 RepID=A0A318J673_9NEIS|nr:phage late control D family protein [Aquitalea magnusonii]PXX42209.1 phage protein D [Aquitalea magnusonii]
MILNTLPIQPYARAPRGRCLLNGREVAGWISLEVENNSFHSADTFRALFAISLLPPDYDLAWFASQLQFRVQIELDDGNGMVPFILGNADSIRFDPVARTVELEGRDLTAVLIDDRTTEHYRNLTASQIATKIAQKHGLTPVVTPTSAKAGSYYQIDHVQMQDEQSEWELLFYLAQREEFVCFVRGIELHFEPMPSPATADRYQVDWQELVTGPVSNVADLKFERTLTVSKGVVVEVHSFNAKQKKGFQVSYPKVTKSVGGARAGQAKPKAQVYRYTFPNLTHEQALQKAQALYKQIIQHEMKLDGTLPGDNLLMPEVMIEMTGTGSQFDQPYYVDSIRRHLDVSSGYTMSFSAKNHNPNSTQAQ